MNIQMTPALFEILATLSHGPNHGYAIAQKMASLSGPSRKPIGPAVLYTSIQKLLDAKLIEERPAHPGDDPRRKTYQMTRAGQVALSNEAARQRRWVEWAETGMSVNPVAGGA